MNRAAWLVALALAAGTQAGCSSSAPPPTKPGADGEVTTTRKRATAAPADVIAACAKHLELLHRRRTAQKLGEAAALAGPIPTAADFDASRTRLRDLGLAPAEEHPGDALDRTDEFAKLVAPALADVGHALISWTPDPNDVGLAKVRSRAPGRLKELWGRAISYELLVLDGFVVPDFPTFFEKATDHREAPRETPRKRLNLIWIDAQSVAKEREAVLSDSSLDKADVRAALARLDEGALLHEVELREAAYLRLQDEIASPSRLDEAATWIEVQEGEPDIALGSALIGAGDLPEERRRQKSVQTIFAKLAAADRKEERSPVLTLPRDQRAKRLKELAPYYVRSAIEGR